jgi:hypothetical protein
VKKSRNLEKYMSYLYLKLFVDSLEKYQKLNDTEFGRLIRAALSYKAMGVEVELTGRESLLWDGMKLDIDRDNERYAIQASINSENGKKGGRPKKRTKANESEKNRMGFSKTEKSQDKDKDKDKDILSPNVDSIGGAIAPPRPRAPAKEPRHKHGEYGWVLLTDAEYARLVKDLGDAEAKRCISYVDESAQKSGNKNRWKDWNLTVRTCHRDHWGQQQARATAKPTMLGIQPGQSTQPTPQAAKQNADWLFDFLASQEVPDG